MYCPHERIREEFKNTFSCLAKKLTHASSDIIKETPLTFLLRLLSSKFNIISDYPCKQFFELFCEIIDFHFILQKISDKEAANVFDAELLLSQIIDKIKVYNKASSTVQPQAAGVSSLGGSVSHQINTSSKLANGDDGSSLIKSPSVDQAIVNPTTLLLSEDAESIYIGLLQLAGKIIDNFDIAKCEQVVARKQLVEEIFGNFLFKSVFDQGTKS